MKKNTTKKYKIIHVSIDMFADGIIFLLSDRETTTYTKAFKENIKISDHELKEWQELFENAKNCKGFVSIKDLENDGRYQIVVFTDEENWKHTFVHESLHAVEKMCEHRHIPISKDTEELRCMLLSEVVKHVI